ncbi:MAG: hypothetical protein ACK52P_04115, partial [Alphaproteobacteria bacterium]
ATSIRAGAAMIRAQATRRKSPTQFDPPLVAIAYNAGSLRARADGGQRAASGAGVPALAPQPRRLAR